MPKTSNTSEKINRCHCADAVCRWRGRSLTLIIYRSNMSVSWNQARGRLSPRQLTLSNHADACAVSQWLIQCSRSSSDCSHTLVSAHLFLFDRLLLPAQLSGLKHRVHTAVQDWSSAAATCPRVHCARSPYPSAWFMGTEKRPRSSCLHDFHVGATHRPNLHTLGSTG